MIIKQHSLGVYFALTFMLFWAAVALGRIQRFGFFAPIAGALAPGVAALVVTGIGEGEDRARALVRRLADWRVAPTWYVIALGLPIAGWLIALAVATLFGAFSAAKLRAAIPVLMTSWIMFLFAAVEELGWRGFALPRLLALRSALAASLILGTLHAIWHWPAVVPGSAWNDIARLATGLFRGTTFIVAEAVLITWIFQHTRGSLLPVTLYHGMSNVAQVLYQGIERMPWLRPSISVLMAATVALATGPTLMRTPRLRDDAQHGALHEP
jgi:membrane protease YdiL (CAAX protease family)